MNSYDGGQTDQGMELMSTLPWEVWTVLTPFAAAVLAFLFVRRAAWVFLATIPLVLLALVGLLAELVQTGPRLHRIGGWGAPLGIELYADGLSGLMLLLTAVIISFTGFYTFGVLGGRGDRKEGCDSPLFWPLVLFFWGSLNALFLSWDIFNLYVTLELLTLSTVPLITLAANPAALTAGIRYLLVALLGSLAYLLGVALLYAAHGTLNIGQLEGLSFAEPTNWVAIGLVVLGLMLKTALFPLHFWLPSAYAQAPSAVSAMIAALATKASFYLLARLWFSIFPAVLMPAAGQLLGVLGAAAILWGSLLAWRQGRVKTLLAYSSVAQIGYLFFLFPLATVVPVDGPALASWLSGAWGAAAFLLLAHACAKAAMFMAAGCMAHAVGSDLISDLTGIARHLPRPVFAFFLGGVTLMGLPPSGGFSSKWLFLKSAVEMGQWWWAPVMVAGGLMAAGYVFRVLRQTLVFLPVDIGFHPVPEKMQWAALLLALISVLLGLSGSLPLDLLAIGWGRVP
jgi:multicomponent Na+:H+ antiporter subunit D